MPNTPPATTPKRKLIVGGAAALAVSTAALVLFVLPAEFGIDPTGFGKATGLSRVSEANDNIYLERGKKRRGALTISDKALAVADGQQDHWEFELGPYESIEFKYLVEEGQPVHFFWQSTQALDYDMHAHPDEGGEALTESYSIDKADHLGGRYIAPFTGIHGWHWENRNLEPVRIKLDASGGITSSKIFSSSGELERPLAVKASQ